jgi:hypothetical protein
MHFSGHAESPEARANRRKLVIELRANLEKLVNFGNRSESEARGFNRGGTEEKMQRFYFFLGDL